jgi:uncharacterized membrane protein YkvA (DUF1232 family)
MMLKSEEQKLVAKKREWEESLRESNRWWRRARRQVNKEFKNMLNWLLFYKRPKSKLEYTLHVIEVICFYVILQFAWKGIFGG